MVDFLVLGNFNAVKYKDIFPLFKDGDISFGWNRVVEFDGGLKFGNIRWFSNISDYCPPPWFYQGSMLKVSTGSTII